MPLLPQLAGPTPCPASMRTDPATPAWWSCSCSGRFVDDQLGCQTSAEEKQEEEEVIGQCLFASCSPPKDRKAASDSAPTVPQPTPDDSKLFKHISPHFFQAGKPRKNYSWISLTQDPQREEKNVTPTEVPTCDLLLLDAGAEVHCCFTSQKQRRLSSKYDDRKSRPSNYITPQELYVTTTLWVCTQKARLLEILYYLKSEQLILAGSACAQKTWRYNRSLRACLLLVATVLMLTIIMVGNHLGDAFMLYQDMPLRGDPSYLVDFFSEECMLLKARFSKVLHKIEAQNKRRGWLDVKFEARGDKKTIEALYFPSVSSRLMPRVVVVHGMSANYLHHTVQTAAHLLRSMNISVLLPNLRHHGGRSALLSQIKTWWGQHDDVLGAWDYAVLDPHGKLGGSLESTQVGLMGFDYGGFAVQAAFGIEPRIGSMFLDGAVHDVLAMFSEMIQRELPASLRWAFVQQALSRIESIAGYQFSATDPRVSVSSLLASRTQRGVIGIVHSITDTVVSIAQYDSLMQTLSRNKALGDAVLMQWKPAFQGDTHCKERRETHLQRYEAYQKFLCGFWWSIFGNHPQTNHCLDFD